MAKPTEAQVRQLELTHKALFVDLVLANKLWISLLPKVKGKSKTSKEYLALMNLAHKIASLAGRWYARQLDLEKKAKVPPIPKDLFKYFLQPANQNKLVEQAKMFLDPTKKENQIMGIFGMGIIPLIIWAVVLIVLAFTAYEITDQLNTTAEEKADLLKTTTATLKDLNISGQEAANIISTTQAQASDTGDGLGFGSLIKWGAIAFVVYEFVIKPKQQKGNATTLQIAK